MTARINLSKTAITDGHVPDAVYAAVREHFEHAELVNLTYAVVAINSWNRLAISVRSVAGSYTSPLSAT